MHVLTGMLKENADMRGYFPLKHKMTKARIALGKLWKR
jgi:hypothetical protein